MMRVQATDSTTPTQAQPGGAAAPETGAMGAGEDVLLRFAPMPEHVRTARLVAVALARRAGVEDGLLDEVRLAVGEACSRAVGLHRAAAPDAPVVVRIHETSGRFGVEVTDVVTGGGAVVVADEVEDSEFGGDMGLAVLRGLVDDLDVRPVNGGGMIRMGWPNVRPSHLG